MENLGLIEEIIKIRKDLVETGFEYFIDFALKGTVSIYHTGNFLLLLDTHHGTRRESEKDLAEKVDQIVKEENFDLTKYNNKKYIIGEKEAHEKAFPIYKKVHEKFGVPFEHLLSASYLSKK